MSDLHARVMRMLEDRASQGGAAAAKRKRSSCPAYVDNAENRRLGRVGKPKGTAKKAGPKKKKASKKGGIEAGIMAGARGRCPVYVDNAENRRLCRVGKPKGSVPVSGKKGPKKVPAKKKAPAKKKGGIRAGGNDWVNYVKQYARMNGLTYGDALAQAGPSYHAQG